MEDYDVLILGSGEGGKYLSWNLGKQGQKVAVIERKYIGGSCPNIACLPSKNVIHSAKVASFFSRGQEFGMSSHTNFVNMQLVRQRKRQMVEALVQIHLDLFKKNGVELIHGSGAFVGAKTLEVTDSQGKKRTLTGKKIILSTGSRETIENIPGILEAKPLTHIEALELDHLPEHLIILGGGYIGLEFAQAMRRFGSHVTIIERNDRLVHHEDQDVSEALFNLFKEEGINFIPHAKAIKIEGVSGQKVVVHLSNQQIVEGTDLLLATGRTPNTSSIGLEKAGVDLMPDGHIKVNDKLETTAPDIWAVGDCCGSPHFSHIAFDDFRIVFENMNGGHRVKTGRQVPYCLFIDPELARVGLNETEAKAKGIPYRLAKIPMSMSLRAMTLSETYGFMKALVDTKTDLILGITVLGVGAGEVIAPVQIAMQAGLPYTVLKEAIFTHPTLIEGLINLFTAVPPRS